MYYETRDNSPESNQEQPGGFCRQETVKVLATTCPACGCDLMIRTDEEKLISWECNHCYADQQYGDGPKGLCKFAMDQNLEAKDTYGEVLSDEEQWEWEMRMGDSDNSPF